MDQAICIRVHLRREGRMAMDSIFGKMVHTIKVHLLME